MTSPPRTSISSEISKVVLGGAAWSHQINASPFNRPVIPVILHAFEQGIRTIDTSPYYVPSEEILGQALSSPELTSKYSREEYFLMTKVGRLTASTFDYSPAWVRKSVLRSLDRFRTNYLDVVFCHDVEFVEEEDVVAAIGVLWSLVDEAKIRYIGISGYSIQTLVRVSGKARERYGKPIDIVQNWGQMTLQNTRLKDFGLKELQRAGVLCVASSSPLNIGLLRRQGVPEGDLGDWHPAPKEFRAKVKKAAEWVGGKGVELSDLALRYAFQMAKGKDGVVVIVGPGSVEELEGCVEAARRVGLLGRNDVGGEQGDGYDGEDEDERVLKEMELIDGVRDILGEWIDFCFESPPKGWDVKSKKMVES